MTDDLSMLELSELSIERRVSNLQEAIAFFGPQLDNLERQLAAQMLTDYPGRNRLEVVAGGLRDELGANTVQVNALNSQVQTTIATAPVSEQAVIPVEDSLCMFTVGGGEPVAVADVADEFLTGHPVQGSEWGSWASAPIVVLGCNAGSVCALELHPRAWTERDQRALQAAAAQISAAVLSWTDRPEAD